MWSLETTSIVSGSSAITTGALTETVDLPTATRITMRKSDNSRVAGKWSQMRVPVTGPPHLAEKRGSCALRVEDLIASGC